LLRTLGLCAALATLLGASVSHAAGEKEDEDEKAATTNADAKKRFTEGNARYSRGDYDGAIE